MALDEGHGGRRAVAYLRYTSGDYAAAVGLKLEAGKGPVEVIVIDHVEKPSAN